MADIEEEKTQYKVPLSQSRILEKLPSSTKTTILNNDLNLEQISQTKITIRFQPIGSVLPLIHPKVFKISSNQSILTIYKFLLKKLKISPTTTNNSNSNSNNKGDDKEEEEEEEEEDQNNRNINPFTGSSLYLYINNSISPSMDENLGNLFTQFQINNELIISYCNTVAFG